MVVGTRSGIDVVNMRGDSGELVDRSFWSARIGPTALRRAKVGLQSGAMNNVSDAFLLEVAGIAASLLGFFVVGVFFFVQRGMFPRAAEDAQRYMQAATGSIIVVYGMTMVLSLALVVLPSSWVSLMYLGFSLVLLWSVAQTNLAIRRLHRALDIRLMSPLVMWSAAVAIAGIPWVLGGSTPSRAHLAVAVGVTGLFAFTSSASLVLSAFDISRLEATVASGQKQQVGQVVPKREQTATASNERRRR